MGRGGFLDWIEKAFDWPAFEALLAPIHASVRGAPGYPPLTLFKIVLLQQWHTLSDPGAEEAVRDRLSFRRFCGLPLEAETPDHASIWRFRQTIDELGLSAALLAETNRQLGRARPHRQARHAGGRDPDRRSGQASALRKRRHETARSGRAGDDEAQKGPFCEWRSNSPHL
jgi:Transposase domain (DUF772)